MNDTSCSLWAMSITSSMKRPMKLAYCAVFTTSDFTISPIKINISLTDPPERCSKNFIFENPIFSTTSERLINFMSAISSFTIQEKAKNALNYTSSFDFSLSSNSFWKTETRLKSSALMAALCCCEVDCSSTDLRLKRTAGSVLIFLLLF